MKIVLDTNVLLACYSPHARLYPIWRAFRDERFSLCLSTSILDEYAEVLNEVTTPAIAHLITDIVVDSPNSEFVTKHFFWQLIDEDPNDNKFIDCGLMTNADYFITEDPHFCTSKLRPLTRLKIIRSAAFLDLIGQS